MGVGPYFSLFLFGVAHSWLKLFPLARQDAFSRLLALDALVEFALRSRRHASLTGDAFDLHVGELA